MSGNQAALAYLASRGVTNPTPRQLMGVQQMLAQGVLQQQPQPQQQPRAPRQIDAPELVGMEQVTSAREQPPIPRQRPPTPPKTTDTPTADTPTNPPIPRQRPMPPGTMNNAPPVPRQRPDTPLLTAMETSGPDLMQLQHTAANITPDMLGRMDGRQIISLMNSPLAQYLPDQTKRAIAAMLSSMQAQGRGINTLGR